MHRLCGPCGLPPCVGTLLADWSLRWLDVDVEALAGAAGRLGLSRSGRPRPFRVSRHGSHLRRAYGASHNTRPRWLNNTSDDSARVSVEPVASCSRDSASATVELLGNKLKVEVALVGMTPYSTKAFGKGFGVSSACSGPDLRTATDRVPCSVGPLQFRSTRHACPL